MSTTLCRDEQQQEWAVATAAAQGIVGWQNKQPICVKGTSSIVSPPNTLEEVQGSSAVVQITHMYNLIHLTSDMLRLS